MKWTVIVSLCLGLISCDDYRSKQSGAKLTSDEDAWGLIQKNCVSCHTSVPQNSQIAPSLQEIQNMYHSHFKGKGEAQSRMVSFVQNPTKDRALMQEAVSKYGLMPSVRVGEDEIQAMARYILEHDFGLATGTHSSLSSGDSLINVLEKDEFVKAGRDIAMKTQNYLGSQLMGAIHSGGFAHAVEFCHLKASVIMDSLSNVYHAEISRRTDKARNPDHQASDDEIAYMEEIKKMNTEERLLTARKVETDSGVVCYFPILTKEMCLSCHGRPNMDIESRTLKRIDALYPEDKARGYHQGDVRGLFSVYFRKKMGQETE